MAPTPLPAPPRAPPMAAPPRAPFLDGRRRPELPPLTADGRHPSSSLLRRPPPPAPTHPAASSPPPSRSAAAQGLQIQRAAVQGLRGPLLPHGRATPSSLPRWSAPPRAPPMAAPPRAPPRARGRGSAAAGVSSPVRASGAQRGRGRAPWAACRSSSALERRGRGSAAVGVSSLGGATGGRRRSELPPLTARPELRSLTSALDKLPQTDLIASLKSSFLGNQVELFQVELLEKVKLPQTGP